MSTLPSFFAGRDRPWVGLFPSFYTHSYLVQERCAKKYGANVDRVVVLQRDGRLRMTVSTREEFETLGRSMLTRALTDPHFITTLREESTAADHALQVIGANVPTGFVSDVSTATLSHWYAEYVRAYEHFCFVNIPAWYVLGDAYAAHARAWLDSQLPDDKARAQQYFQLLSTPLTPTYVFSYETAILALALAVHEGILKPGSDGLRAAASRVAGSFGWIPFDYLGPTVWSAEHVENQALQAAKEKGAGLREELDKRAHQSSRLAAEQKHALDALHAPDDVRRWFSDLQTIAVLQDEKKEACTRSHVVLQTVFLPEVSRRLGYSLDELRVLTEGEMERLLSDNPTSPPKTHLAERKRACVVECTAESYQFHYGDECERLSTHYWPAVSLDHSQLKGQTASLGVAVGTVRVLASASDLHKVKQGDVLVTTMTTPDFVPAMKKASAIVTDEGGVTCHAAIVSRELGIPCIIATRHATHVLKDGDVVEVDANAGIVRVVTRA